MFFTTDYNSILKKIDLIDPLVYATNRNYIDGAVTYLSPYISRGVISTKQVLRTVLQKGHPISAIESFVKELCWRDYFQRVAQVKNPDLPIRQAQTAVLNYGIPVAVLQANTGIAGIDNAIKQLYETGYMHNHCRMYTASLVCNIAKSHWHNPAQWMYYYLLDADWASNACSWQWVAGANSHKKYYCNQENINKYTFINQSNTYLDCSYEEITKIAIPDKLINTQTFLPEINLPETTLVNIDKNVPCFIYNYYNLDPDWHKNEAGNRILLIDPQHFKKYPISKRSVDFMLALSKNIPHIQLYKGSFTAFINEFGVDKVYYKEHPFNVEYKGTEESRDWIAENVSGYYPSFFNYWNKIKNDIQ